MLKIPNMEISPPRVDSSKGPPRKITRNTNAFTFVAHGKNCLKWPEMGPGGFFLANPDLANILGKVDFDFDMFFFEIQNFQISRFADQACALWALNLWGNRSCVMGEPPSPTSLTDILSGL